MKNYVKYIPYVIGTILSFPIVIYHTVTCTGKKGKKPRPQTPDSRTADGGKTEKAYVGQPLQGGKRTCGHSQKDVRVNNSQKK